MRSMVEGASALAAPSTALRAVPLPHFVGEDKMQITQGPARGRPLLRAATGVVRVTGSPALPPPLDPQFGGAGRRIPLALVAQSRLRICSSHPGG